MYIEPTTNIKILHNVPLDNSYTNTIYFADRASQLNYFVGKVKYNLDKQSYQRYSKGVARVSILADNLYNCNYMMFQNTNFGTKWFYAFITNVEYINNETSEITYVIDRLQTWLLDCTIGTMFVEREHSVTDEMFEHLLDEGLATGDYIIEQQTIIGNTDPIQNFVAILMATEVMTGTDPQQESSWSRLSTRSVGNVISSIYYIPFDINIGLPSSLQNYLNNYDIAGKKDAILGIYTIPKYALKDISYQNGVPLSLALIDKVDILQRVYNLYPTSLNGYTNIKNKKLFSSPYCYIELTNNNGSSQLYKPEDISYRNDDNSTLFEIMGNITPNGELWCRPTLYQHYMNDNISVSLSGYPQGILNYSNFLNWWASEKYSYVANSVNSIASYGFSLLGNVISGSTALNNANLLSDSGNRARASNRALNNTSNGMAQSTIGSLNEGFGSITNELAQAKIHDIIPASVIGSASGNNQLMAEGRYSFTVNLRTIRKEYAIAIDDYFTKYGYKTSRLKVPNISSRPHWNYVKTVNANITGNIPASDLSIINAIFDKGITFWKNGNEVNHYELDNSPS